MSNLRIGQSPFFDAGIESITTAQEEQSFHLPTARLLPPSQQPGKSVLEHLLRGPTLDHLLYAAIEPEVSDLAVLLPQGFARARRSLLKAFQGAQMGHMTPAEARVMGRAERLLHENETWCEQAQDGWYALLKG